MKFKRRKIVHICTFEKFINDFILFNENHCKDYHHEYFILGFHEKREKYSLPSVPNLCVLPLKKSAQLSFFGNLNKRCKRADRVVIHGLFNSRLLLFLFLNLKIVKKSYWMMWGADLYARHISTVRGRILDFLRRTIIKNLEGAVTYLEGDYEYAKKRWGLKGTYNECILYPSNVFKSTFPQTKNRESGKNILIGNSADPTNNHVEAFEMVVGATTKDDSVYLPLSYGDEHYREKIISKSKKYFGQRVIPIVDFIPLNDYLKFLSRIDIAVFNHRRQQAMGVTIGLLGHGKTVYLRTDVSQWDFFKKIGVIACDINDFKKVLLDEPVRLKNQFRIKEYFSEENYIKQLRRLYTL